MQDGCGSCVAVGPRSCLQRHEAAGRPEETTKGVHMLRRTPHPGPPALPVTTGDTCFLFPFHPSPSSAFPPPAGTKRQQLAAGT